MEFSVTGFKLQMFWIPEILYYSSPSFRLDGATRFDSSIITHHNSWTVFICQRVLRSKLARYLTNIIFFPSLSWQIWLLASYKHGILYLIVCRLLVVMRFCLWPDAMSVPWFHYVFYFMLGIRNKMYLQVMVYLL